MVMLKRLCAIALLALSNGAGAVLPDSGWYWNKTQPGRGFQIEIQDNLLFVAGFAYDLAGNQIFVVSGGQMASDHNYLGDLFITSGGTCFGCPFRPHTETLYGTILITFVDALSATININGQVYHVERQQFGIDFTSIATPILGEWAIVDGDTTFPIYGGERIRLFKVSTYAQGQYAVGNRAGETGANDIAVGYLAASGNWVVLLDSSASYYRFYSFKFAGLNRIEGTFYIYLKTSSPGSGTRFIGERIKSAAAAAGQNAPGTGKALHASAKALIPSGDELRSAYSASSIQASDEVQATALQLQSVLTGAAAR